MSMWCVYVKRPSRILQCFYFETYEITHEMSEMILTVHPNIFCLSLDFGSVVLITEMPSRQMGLWHDMTRGLGCQKQHYDDVIMTMLESQITSLTVVYSTVYSGVHQRKHQSSASLAFVREIHRGPVNFPHKWPVTRKMFPFDDVIMSIKVRDK